MQLKFKNLLLSFLIIAIGAIIIFILYYPSNSELGRLFGVDVVLLMIRYAALIIGLAFLLLRLFKFFKSFPLYYVFIGTLNFAIGIFALALYFFDNANVSWFHLFIPNLLVGVLIYSDIYVLNNKQQFPK